MFSLQRNQRPPLPPQSIRWSVRRQSRRQRVIFVLIMIALALAFWAILAVQPPATLSLQRDQPSPISIQAARSISYISESRTDLERARAESSADTVVYARELSVLTQQRTLLSDLLLTITQIRDDPTLRATVEREKIAALPSSTLVISDGLATQIVRLDSTRWAEVQRLSLELYDYAVGEYQFALDDQAVAQLRSFSLPYRASLLNSRTPDRDLMVLFASSYLKPNLVIDEDATRTRKAEARAAVKPVTVRILEGESIIRAGDVVTVDVEEKLKALGELSAGVDVLIISGKGVLAALLAIALGWYMAVVQRDVLGNLRALLTIVLLCIIAALLARLVATLGGNWLYAFPLGVIALLLAALFTSGLALFVSVLLALLVAFLSGGQINVAAALMLGTIAGVFMIGRGERSLKFILAGLAIGSTTALAAIGLALIESQGAWPADLGTLGVLGLINGAATAIIALGLYNIIGHLAGIVTPLQLMELAHPAQPLLRKLIREAPGTYYHSVAVGNLAESAAEAIGADALLLRVASYYHDIGKTVRPFFFTDNQSDRENVHNDLDPDTSAGIIADHVREGIIMAQAAHVPGQIIDFIATHHGTSVIRHFYQLALQRNDTVNIDHFRYPGPRPRTREQAIMMLADTTEATVRAKVQHGKVISAREHGLRTSDTHTLEELVSSIIEERVHSGQLDESPLTLQDIAKIRLAFISTLQGIYHPRVEYAPQVVKT
jgi:putative nucleotidyltransferase with HDIG domain